MVDRRAFIGTLAGGLLGPRTAAQAQPTTRLRRIGWLDYSSSAENLGTFVQAMGSRGWIQGTTFKIEYRGGEGSTDRLSTVAVELVRIPVELIVAPGTPEALAAKKATPSIPVVMTDVDDPVERGLVATLARPGANVTGLTNARKDLSGKLLSLVRELLPRASSLAALWDSDDPEHAMIVGHLRAIARTLGFSLNAVQVRRHTDVEPAFAAIKKQGNQALVVPSSGMLIPRWIADLALKFGLPLVSTSPAYVYEGGFMAYTDDWNAVFDRVANFVDRILKGAKPGDLPVELPAKFRLIVNARTAAALGLALPLSILVRADSVIE